MSRSKEIINTLEDAVVQVDDLMGVVRRGLDELDQKHGTKLFTSCHRYDVDKAAELLQTLVCNVRRDVQNKQALV